MKKLLANENIARQSIDILRAKDYDVLSISEGYSGIDDVSVLNLAIEEERIIITHDSDYGNLVFQHRVRPPNGIIFLRLSQYMPSEPAYVLDNFIKNYGQKLDHQLVVLTREDYRIRSY